MLRAFAACLSLICLLFAGCGEREPPREPVRRIAPWSVGGDLVVLVRNGPNGFYVNEAGEYAGLEYDLVKGFADRLALKVRFVIVPRVDEMKAKLARGEAHLGVGLVPDVRPDVRYGPAYRQLVPTLVTRTDGPAVSIDTPTTGVMMVRPEFEPLLIRRLSRNRSLSWNVARFQDDEDLVEKVASRLIDSAWVDRRSAEMALNYYPDATIAQTLPERVDQAWAWPTDTPDPLVAHYRRYFDSIRRDGTLARLLERYFGHVARLQPVDASTFLTRRVTLLPRFRRHFLEAEALSGIDWRFLAALAYQESHWNPLATSPYGVRGMMMLTSETADRLGIENRLDARQSILGGARYLALIKDGLPPQVIEPDRTWLALAAYNIGMAHLFDARALAKRLGKRPDAWADLKTMLPLLRQYEYFSTLKYGYARGGETVIFVENIRNYYDILVRFEHPGKAMFPAFNEQVSVANPEHVPLRIVPRDATRTGS